MKTADRIQANILAAAREDYRQRVAAEDAARDAREKSFEGLKLSWKLMNGRWPTTADDYLDMMRG